MENTKKTIGENIRYERLRRNISLEELAELVGLTPGFLGLVERGHRGTDVTNLIKIANLFGVSMDMITKKREIEKQIEMDRVSEPSYANPNIKRSTINALIHSLNAEELEFVINVIKALRTLHHKD